MSKPQRKAKAPGKAKSPQIATPSAQARTRGNQKTAPEPAKTHTPDATDDGPFIPLDKVDPRAYVPTEKDRRIIAMGKSLFMTDAQIAAQVGVSETTLKKYYKRELAVGTDAVNLTIANNLARIAASSDNKNAVGAARYWLDRFGKLPPMQAASASASFTRTKHAADDDDDGSEVEVFTLNLGPLPGLEDDDE